MSLKRGRLVIITGDNGGGKSQLSRIAAAALGLHAVPEGEEDYPYFSDFLIDKKRWAFHNQLHFIGHKFRQQIAALESGLSFYQERGAYDCYEVFTRMVYEQNLISDREFSTLSSYYQLLYKLVRFPDLIIVLHAHSELLMQRVKERNRDIDAEIDQQYLEDVHRRYLEWGRSVDFCPVMMIDTSVCDFVHDAEARASVLQQAATALGVRR